jgi:hypothetical protein
MITSADKLAYTVVAAIENALAAALAGNIPLVTLRTAQGGSLSADLHGSYIIPRGISLDYTPLFDILHLSSYGSPELKAEAVVATIVEPGNTLQEIFSDSSDSANEPQTILSRMLAFFRGQPDLTSLLATFGSVLEGQFAIGISLLTTLMNLTGPGFARAIADGVLAYFFDPEGFISIDGVRLAPPAQLDSSASSSGNLRLSSTPRIGEGYVRDIVAVIVESVCDTQFELRDRYYQMIARLGAPRQEVATRWIKGFATMAESGVMAAVEETLLGISAFATNSIISAAAGTFAGTVARKATQHVFLSEMGV